MKSQTLLKYSMIYSFSRRLNLNHTTLDSTLRMNTEQQLTDRNKEMNSETNKDPMATLIPMEFIDKWTT